MTATPTVRDLLARCLRAVGVGRVFTAGGDAWRELEHLPTLEVGDPTLAALLADAAGRVGTGAGAAALPGARLRLSSVPGGQPDELVVRDPAEVPLTIAAWSAGRVHGATELVLDVDLDAPAPAGAEPVALTPTGRPMTLDPAMAEVGLVVLAGPGVLRAGAVEDLRTMAHHAGVGVVNTWGAKGVFRWDDPAHHGTAGLQARDFELAGVAGAPLVVAVGIDEDEAPRARWAQGPVLDVEPWQLGSLVHHWPRVESVAPRPPLYTELQAALAPLYDAAAPANPAQAAARLAEALPPGGLVAADPGPVGFWVARCLPTREPGSVVVPATGGAGTGVACALAAALDDRPAVAVTAWPLDAVSEALLELAPTGEHRPAVVAWEDGAPTGPVPEDVEANGGVLRLELAVSDTSVVETVAGPIVAWTDPDGR